MRSGFTWMALATAIVAAGFLCSPRASANACAASCYGQHNQCRIARKGDSSCDAQLRSCLRGCNARR